MPEITFQHPLNYRQETTVPLFHLLGSGESCTIVGSSSMGKSRLVQFLLRHDVQQHYLGDAAATTWLVLADCHRLAELSEWGFFELLLTALTETASARAEPAVRNWLNDLRREAITSGNALLARRHVELAARVLCQEQGLRLCFICDEFDAPYRQLPATALANLRSLRDANKYSLCYVLMLRDHPGRLRAPADNEGFYELVSRSIIGLKPYCEEDARRVIAQIAARRQRVFTPSQEAAMLALSGGHPGLLVALCDLLTDGHEVRAGDDLAAWALAQPQVAEECRKLWAGLAQDEQMALSRLAQSVGASYTLRELLALKGIIRSAGHAEVDFFSPVFREYVLTQGLLSEQELWLDEATATVWVEGRRISDLSRLEYELLRTLYRRLGELCTREEIIAALYPDEKLRGDAAINDNRIDSLIRHLRKAIEPVPSQPRYLLTVRGQGYKLVGTPDCLAAHGQS